MKFEIIWTNTRYDVEKVVFTVEARTEEEACKRTAALLGGIHGQSCSGDNGYVIGWKRQVTRHE